MEHNENGSRSGEREPVLKRGQAAEFFVAPGSGGNAMRDQRGARPPKKQPPHSRNHPEQEPYLLRKSFPSHRFRSAFRLYRRSKDSK